MGQTGWLIAVTKSLRLIGALAVMTVAPTLAWAENEAHPMRFEHLTLADGLSQSNVLSVLQDSDGLMWFATENGLNRFDGYEFLQYRRERGNPNALQNDFIFDIAEDADGNLWLATNDGGIARLNRNTGNVTTWRHDPAAEGGLGTNTIRRLLIDESGLIWIGTRGAGLEQFNPETNTFANVDLGVDGAELSGTIFALHLDGAGRLWIGGDHGLTMLNRETGETVSYVPVAGDANALPTFSVRSVTADSEGRIWAGTFGGGLSRLDLETGHFDTFVHDPEVSASLAGNRVSSVFEDSAGRLWVGTTAGLNLVDKDTGQATRYQSDPANPHNLRDNNITAIFQDRSGLMWFGTQWQGASNWNPATWEYGYEEATAASTSGIDKPNVMAIVTDGADTIWLGTFGDGLNAVNRSTGEVTRYRNDPDSEFQINDNRIMSLMRDSAGRLWVGTMRNGITRFDPASDERVVFQHDANDTNTLGANGIMTMYEASNGDVWVGTFGGGIAIHDSETGTFTRLTANSDVPGSLSGNRVTSFAEDPSGRMWVGTEAAGLNLYDSASGEFHQFRHDPSDAETLAADTIYSIAVDADGAVWVGTHGGGVDRVVGSAEEPESISFANLSQRDGLTNDVVYGLQFDTAGHLWMSTNFGISRLDPANGEIRNLHVRDGLQSEEFNFGAHHRSESGELFFGGHNGYNAFDPAAINSSSVIPLIALTGFFGAGDNERSDIPTEGPEETIEVSWRDDVIAFEFAVTDYAAVDQNRFMYKLEGFDNEWRDLGNRNRITYTDLDDGSYLLRVRASNAAGVWNETGIAVPLRVKAAPWDTWWAYLGYLALIAHVVAGFWLRQRNKLRREEEYSARLEQEVSSRTERLLDKNRQLRELNEALQESSLSDPLTGLRNRRFVFEEISKDLDVIQRRISDKRDDTQDVSELVFMMIDLDNFKPINDTYGHAAGDQLLLELRDVLLGICRRSDFVIRWGGDEFVVVAKQTQADEAKALAERIRASVAAHNFYLNDGQLVRTTCSIGFVSYPLFRSQSDDSSLDQIICIADGLMYEAKKHRDAWVGMLSPTEATASFDCDTAAIEATSVLFQARRAGSLTRFSSDTDESIKPLRASAGL